MGVFDNFPYTNFHEMNLDWIIKKVEEMESAFTELKDFVDAAALIAGVETNQNGTWISAVDSNGIAKIPAANTNVSGTITKNEVIGLVSANAPVKGVTSPQNGIWSSIIDIYGNAVIPEASGSREGVISEDQVESLAAAVAPVQDVKTNQDGTWTSAVDIAGVAKIPASDTSISGTITKNEVSALAAAAAPVQDVQTPDGSVVNAGIAAIPKADPSTYGAVKFERDTDPVGGFVKITGNNYYGNEVSAYAPLVQYNSVTETYDTIRTKFLPEATSTDKGAMSAADKIKLDDMAVVYSESTSIAPGYGTGTIYFTSNTEPTDINDIWFEVMVFKKLTDSKGITYYQPLYAGIDYDYSWYDNRMTVTLKSVDSDTIYVRLYGTYTPTT